MKLASGLVLLIFSGLLSAIVIGAVLGFFLPLCNAFLFEGVDHAISPVMLCYASFLGVVLSFPSGISFGLLSYFFRSPAHWLIGGVVSSLATASLPGAVFLPWVIYCGLGGMGAGIVNILFPNWLGRRLHTEGFAVLRPNL